LPTSSRASDSEPPLKLRCLNRASGTIGAGVTCSQTANPPRARAATARLIADPPPNAPCAGIAMIHQTSAVMPAADNTAPSGSGLRHGPFDSGIRVRPASRASATTGMLMKKIACQEKRVMSTPPSTGLPTMPSRATQVQAAMALGRSASSNTVIRMDSVDGMISAPPMPISTRTAISSPGLAANIAASDAVPNSSSPIIMIRRRPNRSPRPPEVSSSPAKTRM